MARFRQRRELQPDPVALRLMPGPEERLRDLGLSLPAPPAALAHYEPAVRSGPLLFLAGSCSGTVNCTEDFTHLPEVMDGASDLWPGSPPVRRLARTPTGRASWPSIA